MENNNNDSVTTAMVEEWVPAQCDGIEYPLYQVSDQGRVRRIEYSVTYNRGGHLVSATMKQRLVQPKDNGNGYYQIALRGTDGNQHYVMLSRLVLCSFEPSYNSNALDVDHISCNTHCNELSNLRWLTHADNLRQEHRMKQIRKPVRVVSRDHLVQWLFDSVTEAAEYIGVPQGRLSYVLHHGNSINGYFVYFH
ncbi:NUMOD4 domain-containing protein [Levilactobacillus brevis]